MSGDHEDIQGQAESVRTTLGLLPLLALSAALTSPAYGQDSDIVLGEINVEGGQHGTGDEGYKRDRIQSRKATAPLIDTPQTVTVVPEQVIEERAASSVTEVLRNTPGISFDAGENGFAAGGDEIFLRGMKATGSIFIDGARANGGGARDTFNVDQVEVVKGVSSANGRGIGGGYINLVTKTPLLEDFIKASARIGFDDDGRVRARSTVDVNQVVDSFAFRFNGMVEGGDLFGREFSDADAWGVAPSIAYGLDTNFRAILAYEHYEQHGLPDSGVRINQVPGVAIPGAGPRATAGNAPRDAYFHNTNWLVDRPDGFNDIVSDALLARFEYDATDWLTVSNQTRWSRVDREAEYYFAGHNNPYLLDRVNTTFSNQTNLSAEFDSGAFSHTLAAGLEFNREKADTVRNNDPSNTSQVTVQTIAGYVYDTVQLNEHWLVNGGLRAEHYKVDIFADSGLPHVTGTDYENSHTTLGGQIGIIYKPRPEGSIYASYGLSHLPHGSLLSNPDPSRAGDGGFPGFVAGADPIAAHNYEVGVKWDFLGGDLSVTGALFHTEKHKVGYWSTALGAPVYGKQIVQGVELGIAGNITPEWNVFGGIVFLTSERRHGLEVDDALRNGGSGNDYGGAPGNLTATTHGDELAFTPKVSGSLWTSYRWDNGFTFGGGVQYVGSSWIGRPDDAQRVIKNGTYGKVPSYFLLDLMASYEVNDNITLRFNVDNVFDKKYLTTTNWNGNWGYLGEPRTYRFGTSFRF